ncbi:MAG: hypothetical protein Q4D05_05250 [Acinetobacter sp.]|nr:hypothetical protein [Acinetobacter sp.]
MFNFWSWRPRTFLWSDYSLVFDDVINMNVVQIVERHEKMKSEISHIIIPNVAYLNRQAINYKQFLAILKQANQQQFPIYLPQDTASQWEHLKRHLNYPHIPKGKD